MGLTLALNTARASLAATSNQIAVSSRNVAGASDPGYSRKIAALVGTGNGGVVVSVTRATDAALYARTLSANAAATRGEALLDGLTTLARTVGDTTDATSPAARFAGFEAALRAAANRPDSNELARAAIEAAKALSGSLNDAADAVHAVRAGADAAIAGSVARINELLGQFHSANASVVRGLTLGADATDALDDRDRILTALSAEIGVTAVPTEGGGLALYTDSGVPLYDRGARTLSFSPTTAFAAGTAGAAIVIDGVPVTGANSPMPIASGRLAGLAALRDDVAPAYEAQLDAMAEGLMTAFAETDAIGPDSGPRTGLFTDGTGAILPGGTAADRLGLAKRIAVNAAVDPAKGGQLPLLRTGGMNGTDYRDLAAGTDASYAGRLNALVSGLTATKTFDSSLGLGTAMSLADFAEASAGWIEGRRKDASETASYQKTLLSRANEALSNVAGVNGDDETVLTLQLERSYTASAKIISVINDLLKTLLDAVR